MSPLRGDVVGLAVLLALPLVALALRGDLGVDELTTRLPWCLAAAWGAIALLRWASRPQAADDGGPAAKREAATSPPRSVEDPSPAV
jgi:hypothetical protein